MFYCEYSYQQLGKTDEWFKKVSARSAGDKDQVKMDFLNIWAYGSESSAIDVELLERIMASKKEVEYTQIKDGFVIKWYIPKSVVNGKDFNKIPIVIGSDSSENVGRDFTGFIFIDARDLSVIGTCRCNTSNIITTSLFIYKFVRMKNVIFVPERNHVGAAMIDAILLEMEKENINPFTRIYNDIVQNKHKEDKYKDVDIYDYRSINKYRKTFGFKTTSSSTRGRNFLYKTVFFKALEIGADRINDVSLINEMAGLSISKKGRIDHAEDSHDDMVIGYIMACYLLFFGENLTKYDFAKNDASLILSMIKTSSKDHQCKEPKIEINLDELRRTIRRLEQKIKYSNNDTIKVQLKMKIENLKLLLPDEDAVIDIPSMEQLRHLDTDSRTIGERYNDNHNNVLRLAAVI
jgi:hypothetical protein